MKKYMNLVIILAILLTCCACSKKQETPAPTQDTYMQWGEGVMTNEELYGHIDQTVPVDGIYKVWNSEGVKAMSNHPDANFEILCNIDLEGAVLTPISTFTGTINGGNFVLSNFTVQGNEGMDFGFVGVNKGLIQNIRIENATFCPGENAQNIGSLVGDNQGDVLRCYVNGSMTVTNSPEDANIGSMLGQCSGSLKNSAVTVDLLVNSPAAANVGGIAGTVTGSTVEYVDTEGKLDVLGNNKSVGLITGKSTDTVYTYCAFLGASNTIDGKLFTDFTGNSDDDELLVAPDSVRRDNNIQPLPENVAKIRNTVVDTMYQMGTVEWHVDKVLRHSCKCDTTNTCVGVYDPEWTYYGMPYKHGNGSFTSFNYMLDENGYMKDWVYEMSDINGYDTYMGSMCSSAAQMAWWSVSNSTNFMCSPHTMPGINEAYGCITVGEGWWEGVEFDYKAHLTQQYIDNCTEQEFYEVLAQTLHGDLMTQGIAAGYHTVMVAEDPVVVRDQHGNIDSNKSYIITHEQAGASHDNYNKTYTSWRINEKNTFNSIRGQGFCPFRCEELITGEMEPAYCEMLDNPGGYLGMTVGTVKGNYFLDAVVLTITDSKGNVILDKINFPKAGNFDDANVQSTSLCYIDSYDMANFCVPLQSIQLIPGETYSYKVSAHQAPGYDYVVFEDSFTYGSV